MGELCTHVTKVFVQQVCFVLLDELVKLQNLIHVEYVECKIARFCTHEKSTPKVVSKLQQKCIELIRVWKKKMNTMKL